MNEKVEQQIGSILLRGHKYWCLHCGVTFYGRDATVLDGKRTGCKRFDSCGGWMYHGDIFDADDSFAVGVAEQYEWVSPEDGGNRYE